MDLARPLRVLSVWGGGEGQGRQMGEMMVRGDANERKHFWAKSASPMRQKARGAYRPATLTKHSAGAREASPEHVLVALRCLSGVHK